jgi:hypothetical protein
MIFPLCGSLCQPGVTLPYCFILQPRRYPLSRFRKLRLKSGRLILLMDQAHDLRKSTSASPCIVKMLDSPKMDGCSSQLPELVPPSGSFNSLMSHGFHSILSLIRDVLQRYFRTRASIFPYPFSTLQAATT